MVEQPGGRRPFMRGILVHSLTSRGVSFDDAYRAADQVRDRIRGRGVVSREELAKYVRDVLGADSPDEGQAPVSFPKTTYVGTAESSLPFSKGLLGQSLLAASIEPNDAFDVARAIEGRLAQRRSQRIRRGDLRRLIYQTLSERFGVETAERYLAWRKYHEPDRPVIILIGGTTGAGKTSIALEVARRLGISRVMSTDSIRQMMRIMLSPELMPAIHSSSFDAYQHLPHTAAGEDPIIEGCIAQASVVSVGVTAMLDRAVAENTSMVLDGVSLVPGLLDLSAYEDVADIIFLVVATLDEDAFRSRFEKRGSRQKKRGTHRYIENLEAILRIQEHFLEFADRFDVPIVDNTSIDDSVLSTIRLVVERLRNKQEFEASKLL